MTKKALKPTRGYTPVFEKDGNIWQWFKPRADQKENVFRKVYIIFSV